ncbi:hypothetical protein NPIL_319891 [Nephila pilipes]|uniref:Uncharacterized protein n=1 Tax=Nephila pilipes TaxID=299642 RepID=A0A8X6T7I9_NEPPI|nr:hypothetical protein NPIL_319891 [Nephila pilipes]
MLDQKKFFKASFRSYGIDLIKQYAIETDVITYIIRDGTPKTISEFHHSYSGFVSWNPSEQSTVVTREKIDINLLLSYTPFTSRGFILSKDQCLEKVTKISSLSLIN